MKLLFPQPLPHLPAPTSGVLEAAENTLICQPDVAYEAQAKLSERVGLIQTEKQAGYSLWLDPNSDKYKELYLDGLSKTRLQSFMKNQEGVRTAMGLVSSGVKGHADPAERPLAVVLGTGSTLEYPIQDLAKQFRLELKDLSPRTNVLAYNHAIPFEDQYAVTTKCCDVTDCVEDLLIKIDEVVDDPHLNQQLKQKKIAQLLANYSVPEVDFFQGGDTSLVISSVLASQLSRGILAAIRQIIPITKGMLAECEGLAKKLFLAHARALIKFVSEHPASVVYFSTDIGMALSLNLSRYQNGTLPITVYDRLSTQSFPLEPVSISEWPLDADGYFVSDYYKFEYMIGKENEGLEDIRDIFLGSEFYQTYGYREWVFNQAQTDGEESGYIWKVENNQIFFVKGETGARKKMQSIILAGQDVKLPEV